MPVAAVLEYDATTVSKNHLHGLTRALKDLAAAYLGFVLDVQECIYKKLRVSDMNIWKVLTQHCCCPRTF
jgi:hypothetical protein